MTAFREVTVNCDGSMLGLEEPIGEYGKPVCEPWVQFQHEITIAAARRTLRKSGWVKHVHEGREYDLCAHHAKVLPR